MAMIRKRSTKAGKAYYQAVVRLTGFPPASASFPNKTEAKAWANQTEAEMRKNKYFGHSEAAKRSMAELLDRYAQSEAPKIADSANRVRLLGLWKAKIGHMKIADVTPPVVVKARDEFLTERVRGKGKRGNASINRLLAALSHVFSVAEREWEWADTNPVKKVKRLKEPPGRTRFLSDDERERLLAATEEISPVLHTIVVIALSTGARRGEIMNLKWKDVDLTNGRAIAYDTKNTETKSLPLTGLALKLLKEHRKVPRIDSELVFPHDRDGKKVWRFETLWGKALAKAEIENFRFHDLRHSAAAYLAMDGATLPELAEILGHKTLQMVKRYAHLSNAHTSSVVASMNAKIFGE